MIEGSSNFMLVQGLTARELVLINVKIIVCVRDSTLVKLL